MSRVNSGRSAFEWLFNTLVLNKSRLPWIDYLRGIAIVLVVYRHVYIGLERSQFEIPYALERANMIFFSFRMPLFFILSGLFISRSMAKKPLGTLVYNKFEALIYPYLIWAFIQISLQILLAGYTNASRSLQDYSFIFYQPRALDQFWYLPALFNATLVYILTKKKLGLTPVFQIILGLGLYYLAPLVDQISMLSDWMEFYIFFALGDAIAVLFFQHKSQSFFKSYASFIAMIPVFVVTQIFYLQKPQVYYWDDWTGRTVFLAIALIGCLCMFILSFRLQSWKILSFLRVLGYHSLYIYVLHVIVSSFVRMVMTKVFGVNDATILLFTAIAFGVVVPVILYNLSLSSRFLWRLFHIHHPETDSNSGKSAKNKEKPVLQTIN